MPADWREILNFWESRDVPRDPPCPICGHTGWGYGTSRLALVQEDTEIDEHADPETAARTARPVVHLACENCGFLRLHTTDAITRGFPTD